MSASELSQGPRIVADLIASQEGAIVSRILAKKPTGSVTLFAFDQGQSLSEHTAPFDALVHLLDGEAEVTIAGTPHLLTAGQVILMPADIPHAVRAVRRFKMVLTMLRSS